MHSTRTWLGTVLYRLRQVRQQLGFVAALSAAERAEVARWLSPSALSLFQTMSDADQQHSLRVCRGLQARGCTEEDLLAAALLHDVGKAQGRVPFWTRPAIVIGKVCMPRLLARLVLPPHLLSEDLHPPGESTCVGTALSHPGYASDPIRGRDQAVPTNDKQNISRWRRSLSYAWWHADVGADLAAAAGLSERAVLYIRTHHQPHGPAAQLHAVDEVS